MRNLAYCCAAGAALVCYASFGLAADGQTSDADWAKINNLTWQSTGLSTRFPPMQDTLLSNVGGWRSELAAHNIGIEMHAVYNGITDFNQNNDKPQNSYVGQGGDVMGNTYSLTVTYGLADLGLANSKIVACVNNTNSTVAANPPNNTSVGCLSYYQSFFDKKLELKVGFEPNLYSYVGLFTGGDVTLTNTLGAVIPVEAGLSDPVTSPPMANLTYRGSDGFYVRSGVQRSVSPQGRVYEVENNGVGLDYKMDDARVLYVGEVGIDRLPTPGGKRLWVRAGGVSNPTQYAAFDGGKDSNKALWALGDYQLTQPTPGMPFHGLYVGASAMYAPEDVNLYTQNYEARIYYYGPFQSRPFDKVTFAMGKNVFSDDARDRLASHHLDSAKSQTSATVAYSMHVTRGIYLSPAIGYTKNPSFSADIDDALTFKLGLLLNF